MKDGKITDYDGDHIYENRYYMALYAGGVLETYQIEAYGTNIIWKLDTGEVWELASAALNSREQ